MSNLKTSGLNISGSSNALIPSGAILTKAISPSVIGTDYDTDSKCLSLGVIPCDGRSLNTYTFRFLHSVISNIYGGTAYSAGTTDQPGAVTTFQIPNLRDVEKVLSGASSSNVNPSISNVSQFIHNHSTTIPTITMNNTLASGNFTHTHLYTATFQGNSSANQQNHNGSANYNGLANNNSTYRIAKVDGNSSGSWYQHRHNTDVNIGYSSNNNNIISETAHSHGQGTTTSTAAGEAHTHTTSTSISNISTSGSYLPVLTVVYFIKI